MGEKQPEIKVPEEQEVPKESKEALEKGNVVRAALIIKLVGNPVKIEVENKGMNPYMLPTLLRQLAENFEKAVLNTKSLLE